MHDDETVADLMGIDVRAFQVAAFTLGSIIAVSGLATPLLVIIVGIAMLCIAFAYHHLNLWQPTPAAHMPRMTLTLLRSLPWHRVIMSAFLAPCGRRNDAVA